MLTSPVHGRRELMLEPLGFSPAVPEELDGLAGAFLPLAMREGGTLRVRGTLTGLCLRNLTDLAESWSNWKPSVYKRVAIVADRLSEPPLRPKDETGVFAWSGSLRSSHTVVRHLDSLVPAPIRPELAIRVLGLRAQKSPIVHAPAAVSEALQTLGIRFACVRTNACAAGMIDSEVGVLPVVAAALHLAGGGSGTGVHARSWPIRAQLRFPRPGPAIPDLYSGGRFSVRADGGTASPSQMASDLLAHPAFASCLSGCRQVASFEASCGRCPDCTVAALACHAWRLRPPSPALRARLGGVARLPFGDPEIAEDATAILRHWQARDDNLKFLLRMRVHASRLALDARDILNWLGSAARIRPIWPR